MPIESAAFRYFPAPIFSALRVGDSYTDPFGGGFPITIPDRSLLTPDGMTPWRIPLTLEQALAIEYRTKSWRIQASGTLGGSGVVGSGAFNFDFTLDRNFQDALAPKGWMRYAANGFLAAGGINSEFKEVPHRPDDNYWFLQDTGAGLDLGGDTPSPLSVFLIANLRGGLVDLGDGTYLKGFDIGIGCPLGGGSEMSVSTNAFLGNFDMRTGYIDLRTFYANALSSSIPLYHGASPYAEFSGVSVNLSIASQHSSP